MVYVHEFNRLNWCCCRFRMVHFVHPKPELGKSKIPHVFPSTRALTSIGSKNPNRPVIVSGKAIYTEIWMDLGCLIITVVCVYFFSNMLLSNLQAPERRSNMQGRFSGQFTLNEPMFLLRSGLARSLWFTHQKFLNSAFWDAAGSGTSMGCPETKMATLYNGAFGASRSQSVICSIISQLCIHNSRIQREWLSLETATLERFFTTRMISAVCCLRLT